MNAKRMNEILENMTSFKKERYHKSELLHEMFLLQKELVELVFDAEHASLANLKIWDVEKHLEKLNKELNHPADEVLQRFIKGSKVLSNLIKAEVSGNRGEYITIKNLEQVKHQNILLKNIELSNNNFRTEIDAIVITEKEITIIEVKNTGKNIFIDKNGNYYRTGEFLRWDCNIADKLMIKESLLKEALCSAGIDGIRVKSVVAFTNNKIEVQNKYAEIRTCFSTQLSSIVEEINDHTSHHNIDIGLIKNVIKAAANTQTYPINFDVLQYKSDFAELVAIIEDTINSLMENVEEVNLSEEFSAGEEREINKPNDSLLSAIKEKLTSKPAQFVYSALGITFVSALSLSLANAKK